VTFIGDNVAQTNYTAFNILLREDLSLGGLQYGTMDDQDGINCKCDNQFLNTDCRGYTIKSVEEVQKNQGDDPRGGSYFCQRKPSISKSLPDIQSLLTEVVRNYPHIQPHLQQPHTTHLPISRQRPILRRTQSIATVPPHFLIQPRFLLQHRDRDPRT